MSRLQSIEQGLISINQASFQELCDSFLALKNSNYSAFSRTGSQSGKQKTIKGTPDTFLLLPNGKYIFVEYSTNVTAGLTKLQDDVKKCIDESKTGIPLKQIVEIILCVNFNLKAEEIQTVKELLASTNIIFTIYTLDALSIELHLKHRDLAHLYLGLPLDTGQIISIKNFINEYDKASKGIATPLGNTFIHRENEIKEIKNSLISFDFIILTGAPGVGKTKLALEGINGFLIENLSFEAYCISYKNYTLLDDLYQYFNLEKDYLLFVDDANRIDAFSQITGFYRTNRKGKLKIIITVRDYAFQEIENLCHDFSPKIISLTKFSDEQIVDIIKAEPFKILNPDYQKAIVRIADGNPRLAIMTTLLAKAEQNIYALSDVSDLFENYFSTFIKDDGEFANKLNIKCLGLISFFYTIPFKNKELTSPILESFNIEYPDFIDAIDKLDKLELVEIQYKYVKIPEQNLSIYFFYKSFIQDNSLSFEILLDKYFDANSTRFKDCVIPANNTFGYQRVMNKLKPHLQNYWRNVVGDEVKSYKFLSAFWYYMQTETLWFVYSIIESLPSNTTQTYKVKYDKGDLPNNNILNLINNFFKYSENLKDALELSFEYTQKKPEYLAELLHIIKKELAFDTGDELYGFSRQNTLFDIILKGLNEDNFYYSVVFYELSVIFLGFKFRHDGIERKNSLYWYDYFLTDIPLIKEFRRKIWESINLKFNAHPENSFDLLQGYFLRSDANMDVVKFDVPFLFSIIENHLSPDSFEHCRFVQDKIRWYKKNAILHESFPPLINKFTSRTYEMFLKIDWNILRDKEEYEFDDYEEYERLKEIDIRSSFIFNTASEVKDFYELFAYLKKAVKNEWNYTRTLDLITDENFSNNFDLGCLILKIINDDSNTVNYIPRLAFRNQLKIRKSAQIIWEIIQHCKDTYRTAWELSFYENLDESLLNDHYVKSLINTVLNIVDSHLLYFNRLQKFLIIEPDLFQLILKGVVEKNDKYGTRIAIWSDIFKNQFEYLGNDINLIQKAYLQQTKINPHYDHGEVGFLNIIRKNPKFIFEYVNSFYLEEYFLNPDGQGSLGFLWEIEDIELIMRDVFNLMIERTPSYGFPTDFCKHFFTNIQPLLQEKARKFLLDFCELYFREPDKIDILLDIVRKSMRNIFDEILLLYIKLNHDVKDFSKIHWRGNTIFSSGDDIPSDIAMADWKNIQFIVEKSDVGIKLLPIKVFINNQVELYRKSGDIERQRRFFGYDT